MRRNANGVFWVLFLAATLVSGLFAYQANHYRQALLDLRLELPPQYHDEGLANLHTHFARRTADAMARASALAALEAAIHRQDSKRITEIQENLISQGGETEESIQALTLEQATRDAQLAEELEREAAENGGAQWQYTLAAIASLAVAFAIIAWRIFDNISSVGFKIILAAVSGMLWGLAWYSGWSPTGNVIFLGWQTHYGLAGATFAAGVLFPYLKRDRLNWLRAIGLVVISEISFDAAVEAADIVFLKSGPDFVSASLVGAVIVLTGARFIVPLTRSIPLVLVGLPAAVTGGLAFAYIPGEWIPLAFVALHTLMAITIHISESGLRTARSQ